MPYFRFQLPPLSIRHYFAIDAIFISLLSPFSADIIADDIFDDFAIFTLRSSDAAAAVSSSD
jgi:hypothetical protein